MQEWGHWYANKIPQPKGIIDATQEAIIKRQRTDKRNTLLSSDGIIYINNMFPIISDNTRQLADILIDKGLMSKEDLENIRESSSAISVTTDVLAKCNSLRFFLIGIMEYLKAFNQPNLAENIKRKADYVSVGRLSDYRAVCRELQRSSDMKYIWDLMHTEHLWAFDNFFNGAWQPLPIQRVVSHYDMCNRCEQMMLEKSKTVTREEHYKDTSPSGSYKILVSSFFPYFDSRDRETSSSKLLKVVLN